MKSDSLVPMTQFIAVFLLGVWLVHAISNYAAAQRYELVGATSSAVVVFDKATGETLVRLPRPVFQYDE